MNLYPVAFFKMQSSELVKVSHIGPWDLVRSNRVYVFETFSLPNHSETATYSQSFFQLFICTVLMKDQFFHLLCIHSFFISSSLLYVYVHSRFQSRYLQTDFFELLFCFHRLASLDSLHLNYYLSHL